MTMLLMTVLLVTWLTLTITWLMLMLLIVTYWLMTVCCTKAGVYTEPLGTVTCPLPYALMPP